MLCALHYPPTKALLVTVIQNEYMNIDDFQCKHWKYDWCPVLLLYSWLLAASDPHQGQREGISAVAAGGACHWPHWVCRRNPAGSSGWWCHSFREHKASAASQMSESCGHGLAPTGWDQQGIFSPIWPHWLLCGLKHHHTPSSNRKWSEDWSTSMKKGWENWAW